MAAPGKYFPSFSFSGYQAQQPDRPLPGVRTDTEYNNIAQSLGVTIDALADIRRDDGQLQNGIVTPESLSPGMALGVLPPTAWATAVEYKPPQSAWFGDALYQCVEAHVSSVFADDLAAGYWNQILDFGPPVDQAEAAADEAAASAAEAAASAASVHADAVAAANSAASATASKDAAATSATNAAASAAAAAGSATAADSSADRAEAAAAVAIGATTSDAPPATPHPGQLWWQASNGHLFVWYVDPGGAPGQWVQII